jgi:tetratricopeptide (TPR) repeat protein
MSLAIVAVTLAIFFPAASYDYVGLDDDTFVTQNPHVLHGLSAAGFRWAFQFGHNDYWHPLTWLSLMFDVTVFGPGPHGLHLVNILLHTANAVLLFILLRQWTGTLWRSAIVAALFALHPLRVESVAWVTERKDVLCGLFFFLTLLAYGSYVRGRPRRPLVSGNYWLALFFFTCGLMSKAMVVTVPLLLCLADYWPLNRVAPSATPRFKAWLRLVPEKIPFLVLAIASAALTSLEQQRVAVARTMSDLPGTVRIETFFIAYERYLAKTFWPFHLAVHYPHPWHWPPGEALFALLLVIGVSAAALLLSARRPYLFTGWFWFLGALIPVIGLTHGWLQYMADRFTYLPSIGLFIAVAWTAAAALARWTTKGGQRLAIALAAVAVLAACAMRTRDQLSSWRNSETLFRHTLAVEKNSDLACYNLGCFLDHSGRGAEAIEYYRRAVALNDHYPEACNNLAADLIAQEKLTEAAGFCRRALQIRPGYAEAHNNLGLALAGLGDPNAALDSYRAAVRLAPDYAEPRNNIGNALFATGHPDQAILAYREALKIDPALPSAHFNLAISLAATGKTDEAIAEYREAIRIAPGRPEAYNNLGVILAGTGRIDDAIASYNQALQLNPGYTEARENLEAATATIQDATQTIARYRRELSLPADAPIGCGDIGNVLITRGRVDEALDCYRKAIRVNPSDIDSFSNLGTALAMKGRLDEAIAVFRQALRAAPANAALRLNLGNALEDKGRPSDAAGEYRELARLDPANAEARFQLGRVLARLGKTEEAATELNAALRLKPDYAEARDLLRQLGKPAPATH